MPTTTKLTLDQFRAIEAHTNDMIAAAEAGRQRMMEIPPAHRNAQVAGQISYYRNVIAGFKWSLGVARQRCPACRNAG
jgi:hypothetical protein